MKNLWNRGPDVRTAAGVQTAAVRRVVYNEVVSCRAVAVQIKRLVDSGDKNAIVDELVLQGVAQEVVDLLQGVVTLSNDPLCKAPMAVTVTAAIQQGDLPV